ncbi:MAG: hypothetical protein RM338_28465 [Nostoc sp. DedQUE12a]|nr:hypothetical protein [Nostoc sp. DedQUE12a]
MEQNNLCEWGDEGDEGDEGQRGKFLTHACCAIFLVNHRVQRDRLRLTKEFVQRELKQENNLVCTKNLR